MDYSEFASCYGRTVEARNLLLWRRPIPDIRIGFAPPTSCISNVAVDRKSVFVSTFAPGGLVAFDKESGEKSWHVGLGQFANSPIVAGDSLVVGNTNRLVCVECSSGDVRWEFEPYQGGGETIYSIPVHRDGLLFIGDRKGNFHCLSLESGETLWSVRPTDSDCYSINATALLYGDWVITATNRGLVLAYERATGKEVWRSEVPSGSSCQIQNYAGMLVVRSINAIYLLFPTTGELLHQLEWSESMTKSVASCGTKLCVVTSYDPYENGINREKDRTDLLCIENGRTLWSHAYPRHSLVELVWDEDLNVLYEAMECGLGIIDVKTGERLALIQHFSDDITKDKTGMESYVGLPCFRNGEIYLTHTSGHVWAIRNPIISQLG